MKCATQRIVPGKTGGRQKGQALIFALIFLFLGSLLTLSLLAFTSTGLKSGSVYEKKTDELYAADAGAQDAAWLIRYDYLDTFFTNPVFSSYDFTTAWTYNISDNINGKNTHVSIENLWIPSNVAVPNLSQAQDITNTAKLVISSYNGSSNFKIKVSYIPGAGENLTVNSIGVWLPAGFKYVPGSTNLGNITANTSVISYGGGQAIIWGFNSTSFNSLPGVNVSTSMRVSDITFNITSANSSITPDSVAWISTNGVSSIPFAWDASINVFKITSQAGGTTVNTYMARRQSRILGSGIAGDYRAVGNSLMRDTNNIGGEGVYRETLDAASNATINDIPADASVRFARLYWSGWINDDNITISSDNGSNNLTANWTVSSNSSWTWNSTGGNFRGGYNTTGGESGRYLTLKNSLNLTGYAPESVNLTWAQNKSGSLESSGATADTLYFSFSADNGTTWSDNILAFAGNISATTFNYTIPSSYLVDAFKVRFYISGFAESGEFAYLDNFAFKTVGGRPDNSVSFKIDGVPVWFAGNGTAQNGTAGAQEIIASSMQAFHNDLGGFSFVCSKDVTNLVKAFTVNGTGINHPGNALYTVGGVNATPAVDGGDQRYYLAYAGWSLIIVYSSEATNGQSLYLYDTFMYDTGNGIALDFDNDGQPGGTINGFIVPVPVAGEADAAKLTVFVGEGDVAYSPDYLKFNNTKLWDGTTTTGNSVGNPNNVFNSASVNMSANGVDIDTFHVTWASGLLSPGATSAQIDIVSSQDKFNLIYTIIAFRSTVKVGGNLVYEIR
jgi:hypothetical protein